MIDKNYYLQLCEDAQQNMDKYREEAEQHVVSWEYTNGQRYSLAPYYFERKREPRGGRLKEDTCTAYGFDSQGTIRVTKEECLLNSISYSSINADRLVKRVYVKGKINYIEELIYENGLPIRYVEFIVRHGISLEESWHFEEDYEYEKDILQTINRVEYLGSGQGSRHYVYHLSYDDAGKLSQIRDKYDSVVYVKMSSAKAAELQSTVRAALITELKQALLRLVDKVKDDKLCFVAIYLHDEPAGVWNPIFHPGVKEVRLELIQEGYSIDELWNSGEHPIEYQQSIENKELLKQFKLLVQYWEMRGSWWNQVSKLWHEVAYELNLEDWSNYVRLTNDFVFYVDKEGLNVKRELPRSVPAEKLTLLEKKGLYKGNKRTK